MMFYQNCFSQTSIFLGKSQRLTRNCHFVNKTSINQVLTANITFQAAKRLENMTG